MFQRRTNKGIVAIVALQIVMIVLTIGLTIGGIYATYSYVKDNGGIHELVVDAGKEIKMIVNEIKED